MTIEPDGLREELARACADADLDARLLVVFIVDAERPADASPMTYLQPAGYVAPETARVFQAVGSERADTHRLEAHRLAIWRTIPGTPDSALPPMLRHELEHAKRWERSGTMFFEADEWLRAVLPRGHGFDRAYAGLPTEREANAASTAYAHNVLRPEQIAELLELPDFHDLVSGQPLDGDIVEMTFAHFAARDDWGPGWFQHANRTEYLADARRSVAEWTANDGGVLEIQRQEPLIELVPAPANVLHERAADG